MRTYSRTLKTSSIVTLAFFLWSFGPLYSFVAYAATKEGPGSRGQGQVSKVAADFSPRESAGDRFEKALEAIREKIGKADDKAGRGDAATGEIEAIKKHRAEIEAADVEFKKEFAATEKKLKDAKLPKEILDRHYKFVKHYEDNLKELKTNLDDVEQAKTKSDIRAKIEKTRLHLEKVKAPSKHQKLDPNNLPFKSRTAAKKIEPRLKKEDFERDFPQQKSKSRQKVAGGFDFHSAIRNPQSAIGNKPILVASNGSLAGLLSSDNQLPRPSVQNLPLPAEGEGRGEGAISPFALSTSTPSFEAFSAISDFNPQSAIRNPQLILAQATVTPPTADDLAETPEVQFTQDIRDLAAQLGNKPTKIFEWVQNNIEFVPAYGSIQGADMCLQTRQCNAYDTNSLLISLLRVSNLPAHFVYGTIEIPIDKVMNWVGGFTDPRAAVNFIASGGIPIKPFASGGVITKVQMEHVWIETYIPYGNYRGAIMDNSIQTWIPMDGSFKQYTYTNGFDITATVPFDSNAYMSQVQSQNPVHYYQSQIQNYLDANTPDTSIIDVKGYREITQETYHFLPSTLPYKTVAQLGKFSAVPTAMAAKVTFTLSNPATGEAVSYTASTHELAGKRITISYIPAILADEALIANYGGFLYNVPAYMLNLKPVLRVEGVIKATGDAVTLGSEQNLTFQHSQPSGMNEAINKKLYAGAYYAVAMDLQGINENVLGKRNYQLNTNVFSETAGTLGNDDLIGEHLFILATTYHLANDKIYKSAAKLFNTVVTRTLSEGITSFTVTVSYIFGMPKSAMPSGINMDVAMDRVIAVAKDGDTSKEKAYMDISGLVSSYHEHDIFEKIDGFASVSAVRALQVAAGNNIPIKLINAANIGDILPTLQVSSEIKTDIQNAVNAGREVIIPQTNVQINDWNGIGYIVKDPLTGAGTYMITGGLAGGDSTSQHDGMQCVEIFKEPYGWVKDNIDPQARNTIATAATLDIGEAIAQTAVDLIPQYPQPNAYNNVGTCVGVVRKAYMAAGICLDEWSGCPIKNSVGWINGIRWVNGMNGVKYLYDLASKLNLNESVSKTRAPLVGDMVFFKYTDDPNVRDHVGVVTSVTGAVGTIRFVDATSYYGVSEGKMNLAQPGVSTLNKALLSRTTTGCTRCYAGELFDGYGTVRNVCSQP